MAGPSTSELVAGSGSTLGRGPISPAPSTSAGVGLEPTIQTVPPGADSDSTAAELGELAMAFKQATNPVDAASLLLKFLSRAGVKRG